MNPSPSIPLIFLDIQATPGKAETRYPLEIAWKNAKDMHTKSFLIRPATKVSFRALKLTGLSPDQLAKGFELHHVWQQFVQQIPPTAVLVAHHASYEQSILKRISLLTNIPCPTARMICTRKIAKTYIPDLPSYSLRAVTGRVGTPVTTQSKRAATHVAFTQGIWTALVRKTELTLSDFQQLSNLKASKAKLKPQTQVKAELRLGLPHAPGTYQLKTIDNHILYIGKAKDLKDRVNSYFRGITKYSTAKKELISQIARVSVKTTASELEATVVEPDEIKRFKPAYNSQFKSPDTPLFYINFRAPQKISRQLEKGSIGPFKSCGKAVRALDLLILIQKEFPEIWKSGKFVESLTNTPLIADRYFNLQRLPSPLNGIVDIVSQIVRADLYRRVAFSEIRFNAQQKVRTVRLHQAQITEAYWTTSVLASARGKKPPTLRPLEGTAAWDRAVALSCQLAKWHNQKVPFTIFGNSISNQKFAEFMCYRGIKKGKLFLRDI